MDNKHTAGSANNTDNDDEADEIGGSKEEEKQQEGTSPSLERLDSMWTLARRTTNGTSTAGGGSDGAELVQSLLRRQQPSESVTAVISAAIQQIIHNQPDMFGMMRPPYPPKEQCLHCLVPTGIGSFGGAVYRSTGSTSETVMNYQMQSRRISIGLNAKAEAPTALVGAVLASLTGGTTAAAMSSMMTGKKAAEPCKASFGFSITGARVRETASVKHKQVTTPSMVLGNNHVVESVVFFECTNPNCQIRWPSDKQIDEFMRRYAAALKLQRGALT